MVVPAELGPRARRAIADLVRSVVYARKGISRIAVVELVTQFMSGSAASEAITTVENVIDTLCRVHDIGFGTMRGETVLVSLSERRISLPDGRTILLGSHGIGTGKDPDLLFPVVEAGETETLIDLLRELGLSDLQGVTELLPSEGRWTKPEPMPETLSFALQLCGPFNPVTREWSLSDLNARFLNEWFGIVPLSKDAEGTRPRDPSQDRVIKAPGPARLVVEAGPGSGKTHVACERVIALVQEENLSPSRILLLSFTRMAVAELRERVYTRLAEQPNVAALQIRTFDSFASRLLSVTGASGAATYDANIRAAARLLRSGDPLVADAIGQLEHVIIDEAQDLVGDRKALCDALVELLHPECGVTILGDFAQAIYGYQGRDRTEATFLSEKVDTNDFESYRLEHDHRTSNISLKQLFSDARETLRSDPRGSRDTYFEVRKTIQGAALETDVKSFTTHPSTTRGLILTRSRNALFTAAEALRAEGRQFRMRLPDRPIRIAPWIGATLGGISGSERLSRDAFEFLHGAVHPAIDQNCEECWKILLELDGSGRENILVGHVAEALEDAPLELLCDFEGKRGPLLSTIHAVKGREDQRVMLLLTRAPYGDTVDWGEEARTLYVGSTRSSAELRTSWIHPDKYYTTGKPERYWAPRKDHRLIEIGLEGDLENWQDFLRMAQVDDARHVSEAIWRAAAGGVFAETFLDPEGRLLVRADESDAVAIGCLSSGFSEALQSVCQTTSDSPMPERISGFSVVGATTVAVPDRTGNAPSIGLMPLLGGFAQVPRWSENNFGECG
nr:UvrD-helicase domain-containing protein [Aliiroseovarius subalbicans]